MFNRVWRGNKWVFCYCDKDNCNWEEEQKKRSKTEKILSFFLFLYFFCFIVEGIITDKECPNYGEEHAGGGGGGVEKKTTIKAGGKKTTVSSPLPEASDPPQAIEFDEDYEYSLRGRGCHSQERAAEAYIVGLVSIKALYCNWTLKF